MGYKGTSLTKKEWDYFFKKITPIIKEFSERTRRLESGDKKARKDQDEYNRKMNRKYKIKSLTGRR